MQHIKIGVVGGGAAGMTAAITAAWQGADVTLLEGGERVGKKILSTGNGKCNLGNLNLSAADYCGSEESWIEGCIRQFDTMDTVDFFRNLGLVIRDKNGYLYPASEQASAVLDVLRWEIANLGIRVVTSCKVDHMEKNEDGLWTVSAGEQTFHFERVILACGGKAAPKTGSDGSGYRLAKSLGHTLIPVVPALVQLRCRESFLKEVAGVRVEAVICAIDKETGEWREDLAECGELQLTDYGISGIPVFQMSRKINYLLREKDSDGSVEIAIDLLPDYDEGSFALFCASRKVLFADRNVQEFFTGILHKKVMGLFIKLAGLKGDQQIADVPQEKIDAVFALCKDWRLHVTGSNSFDQAQVCAGGVDTKEVALNMESRIMPGLYFAGEILDVDGRCGGYNLQWAWCSGAIAGRAAAEAGK